MEDFAEDDLNYVRGLILKRNLLAAREWLTRERGLTPQEAKDMVFHLELGMADMIVEDASPFGELVRGVLMLGVGAGISIGTFVLARSQAEQTGSGTYIVLYGLTFFGAIAAIRGIGKGWKLMVVRRRAMRALKDRRI